MNLAGGKRLVAAALLLGVAGCQEKGPAPHPHYVLGAPYQAGGVWHYPREDFDLAETGIAKLLAAPHGGLTSNGERFDQAAMAAAHPTLQLPAIVRVTNLDNGRSVVVRVNDRGDGDPHRVIELTQRAATLLGMAQTARVRLQVLPAESHDAADVMDGAPHLTVAAAPRGAVEVAALPPPPGMRAGGGHALAPVAVAATDAAPPTVPLRLPEIVTQGPPQPGRLWVRLDDFEDYQYAAVLRARLIGLGPRIEEIRQGRTRLLRVQIGPLDDVRQADAMLDRALAAGVPDARIVVE